MHDIDITVHVSITHIISNACMTCHKTIAMKYTYFKQEKVTSVTTRNYNI